MSAQSYKLIVGLGNVGDRYTDTRHNLGFMVVDELARRFRAAEIKTKAPAQLLDAREELGCYLAKPTTMMNLSGQAVSALIKTYDIQPGAVCAVYDELDLPFGEVRVRLGGSSAGHNGVQSLIDHIGGEFSRVRLGIGNEFRASTPSERFVLDRFSVAERERLSEVVSTAAGALINWARQSS